MALAAAAMGSVAGAVTGGAVAKEFSRGVDLDDAMDFDQPQVRRLGRGPREGGSQGGAAGGAGIGHHMHSRAEIYEVQRRGGGGPEGSGAAGAQGGAAGPSAGGGPQ